MTSCPRRTPTVGSLASVEAPTATVQQLPKRLQSDIELRGEYDRLLRKARPGMGLAASQRLQQLKGLFSSHNTSVAA